MAARKTARKNRTRPATRASAPPPAAPVFAAHVEAGRPPLFPVLRRNPKLRVRKSQYYGWNPDLPDARDHLYAAPMAISLPAKYDPRAHFGLPPVYDQGQLGS